jgi:hypothetical protein
MFVVTAYFNIVKIAMTEFFPLAITELAESSASVQRIQVSCTACGGCDFSSAMTVIAGEPVYILHCAKVRSPFSYKRTVE